MQYIDYGKKYFIPLYTDNIDTISGNGLVVKEKNTTCTYTAQGKGEFTSVFRPHNHKTRK